MQSRLDWYSSPTSAAPFPAPFWYVALLACPTHATAAQATPGPLTYYELAEKAADRVAPRRQPPAQLLPFHAANVLLQKEDVAMIAFDGEEA